jgi:hypothetical protein
VWLRFFSSTREERVSKGEKRKRRVGRVFLNEKRKGFCMLQEEEG